MIRALVRVLGSLALLLLLAGLVGIGWAAARVARYEQRDDPASLARKAEMLEVMAARQSEAPRPNVVVILFDDLGLGDVGAFGSALATPRIDQLAAEGVAFDAYYAAAPYCTPSRAGLLTGRWPIRTGLTQVVFPKGHPVDSLQRAFGQPVRLPADEITLAEALRAAGYRTGMVGKWHLGDHAPSLPNDLGFESYFGALHSNDMSPLPLYRNREIAEPHPVDQTTLTQKYTDAAVAFIEQGGSAPFFLYLAHSFPHIPLHASAAQAGKSDDGLYGDVLADLDASTGAVVDALTRAGVAENTLVLVTSDNGPWYQGSAAQLRGRKNETFEGGMRVPLIARWPAGVAAGRRSAEVVTALDVFPTVLALAGVPLPTDRAIDGIDLSGLLRGEAALPERPVYYTSDRQLQALRLGRWKLHARHGVFGGAPWSYPLVPLLPMGPWLFDLARDPDESYDVGARRPEEMARLQRAMGDFAAELVANPRGWRR